MATARHQQRKTARISMRLSADDYAAVAKVAEFLGTNPSEAMLEAARMVNDTIEAAKALSAAPETKAQLVSLVERMLSGREGEPDLAGKFLSALLAQDETAFPRRLGSYLKLLMEARPSGTQ